MEPTLFDQRGAVNCTAPRIAWYFYRLNTDDGISEFCVANHQGDPGQFVQSKMPDGSNVVWDRREEGDLLVFRPPDRRLADQGMLWAYDKRLQRGEPMPQAQLEKLALGGRVSG